MKHHLFVLALMLVTLFSCSQSASQNANKKNANDKKVGGSCEGCGAVYESPLTFNKLSWKDTFPDFNKPGPKLIISGIVYKGDGKTPAPGVVLYAYHTDQNGIYPTKGNEKGWDKRHGYLRSWVKTDGEGRYQFITLRPASYPGTNNPAHIHVFIKEPGISEYWIDDFVFDDDPFLNINERNKLARGSNGVLKLKKENNIYYAKRDIHLGKNVPGY